MSCAPIDNVAHYSASERPSARVQSNRRVCRRPTAHWFAYRFCAIDLRL